jgi:molecular chaperone GrpE (heat shock protein)
MLRAQLEEKMAGWGEDMVTAMREGQRVRQLEPIIERYRAAANISLNAILKVLDELEEKKESGKALSGDEKSLRTELHVIRSNIERALENYWRTTYGL